MSLASTKLSHKVVVIVNERITVLSSKPFEQIAALPDQSTEDLILDETKLNLSVWHDKLSSQEHRIVVQVYKPGMLGVGRMYADGFVANAKNQHRTLTIEEWAPFS